VNILGEALDGLGRWYVALPPFLIIGFLAALFFLTGAGQERLQDSASRELAVDELQTVIARSVATQRGYLLTGDQRYLKNYDKIIADVEPRLERLRLAYQGSTSALADVRTLHVLIGKRLVDLSMLVTIQQSQGTAAAVSLVKTSVGADAGEAITDILEQMRSREAAEHAEDRGHHAER
jgi:CHASE3 domain sensor protein